MKAALGVVIAVPALVALPAASAKEFHPGDVRVCNAKRCLPIVDSGVLPILASFYYGNNTPARVRRPALGEPYYELRYRNGYVTGIVATRRLDRFLSYGVFLGRFTRGRWYRVPSKASSELRRLTAEMRPLRLSRAALAKSR